MSESLAYWKLRQVEARNNYDENTSKPNREELLMCKRIVQRIETTLFKRKKLT